MLYHELTVEFTAIGIPGGLRPLISSYGSGTNLRSSLAPSPACAQWRSRLAPNRMAQA